MAAAGLCDAAACAGRPYGVRAPDPLPHPAQGRPGHRRRRRPWKRARDHPGRAKHRPAFLGRHERATAEARLKPRRPTPGQPAPGHGCDDRGRGAPPSPPRGGDSPEGGGWGRGEARSRPGCARRSCRPCRGRSLSTAFGGRCPHPSRLWRTSASHSNLLRRPEPLPGSATLPGAGREGVSAGRERRVSIGRGSYREGAGLSRGPTMGWHRRTPRRVAPSPSAPPQKSARARTGVGSASR